MDKSQRAARGGIERRAYPVSLEVRAPAGGGTTATIEGYASIVERPYEMLDTVGAYTETVRSGAFTRTLSAKPQVQLLLNHGGLAMAATEAGTLRLSEDSRGLHMAAELNTRRNDIHDMVLAIEDGSVSEMSFAFRTTRQEWSPDYEQRAIQEVDIHRGDVSVVNFGANPGTSVVMRAQDFDGIPEDEARLLLERLQRRFTPAETQPSHPLGLYLALAQAQG